MGVCVCVCECVGVCVSVCVCVSVRLHAPRPTTEIHTRGRRSLVAMMSSWAMGSVVDETGASAKMRKRWISGSFASPCWHGGGGNGVSCGRG